MFHRSRIVVCSAVLCLSIGGTAVIASRTAVAAAATATIAFRDDFSGSGLPDPAKWLLTLGTAYPGGPASFGTGEVETLTNNAANVAVHDGSLYITPQRDSAGSWTSARVETNRSDFKPASGWVMRVDGRIHMPDVTGGPAAGYWPAFWMLGGPYRADRWSWPGIGEYDIMENVQGFNKNWGTLHCGTWGGPCTEPEGISNNGVTCPGATCQSAFHVYSFEWDRSGAAEQMRWYTDNQLSHLVNQSQVPAGTWANMTQHAGYFMILNVSMGGAFPNKFTGGPTAATKPGVPMIVDYVQIGYRVGSGGIPTTLPTKTAPPSTLPTTTPPPSTTTQPTSTQPTTTRPSTSVPPTTGTGGPAGLHIVSTTPSSVTIGWSGLGNGQYDILRSGIRIATVTGLTFTDIGLARNTPYLYSVRGPGGTTPVITATISDLPTTGPPTTGPPTTGPLPSTTSHPTSSTPAPSGNAPSALSLVSRTIGSATLGWAGSISGQYEILRSGVRIATVTGLRFTDAGLLVNTPYLYSVRGYGVTTAVLTVRL